MLGGTVNDNLQSGFRIGDWEVYPQENLLKGPDRARVLEPKVMDLLVFLASNPGKVVSRQQLLDAVWAGVVVGDETLSRAISLLRMELGDKQTNPRYLKTISKRGYRLIEQVCPLDDIEIEKHAKPDFPPIIGSARRALPRHKLLWVGGVALVTLLAALVRLNVDGLPGEPARGQITSIAVLPFDNLTGDPKQESFADGMTEALISELSRIGSLRVISRQSVMRFKDTNESMPYIARKLKADAVVEGSAQHIGGRVRISVQLIDAVADKHLWVGTYDRELTTSNIFAIQSEITTAIADELRATLSPEEQIRLGTVPTESMAALEAYFLGLQRMEKRTTQTLAEANNYFQEAIALDPKFALAYVGLADSYYLQISYAGLPRDQTHAKAKNAIEKALELDDRLGEAYATLGKLLENMEENGAAEISFIRAIELNPNYATTYHWYGKMLQDLGRFEEALIMLLKAADLDPFSSIINLNVADSFRILGRVDEALARYHETIAKDPDFAPAYGAIARHHRLVSGRIDESIKWGLESISHDPGQVNQMVGLGANYLHLGDSESAEFWLNRAISQSPAGFMPNLMMETLHVFTGDDAGVLNYGRRAIAIRPRVSFAIMYLRDLEVRAGRYIEARALYERSFPEFFTDSETKIDGKNFRAAIDLASVLTMTGEQNRADLLLNRSLQYIQTKPSDGRDRDSIAKTQIYALQDRREDALSALRQAVDEGWRIFWWYHLKQDPSLESIRGEPEFQAMMNEIEADMAMQLARLNEYEFSASDAADSEL